MAVFERLLSEYPDSIRVPDAKLKGAESAIQAGQAATVPPLLADLVADRNANALLLTAKAFEAAGDQANANTFYRRTYFLGAGSDAAKEAETKLSELGQPLIPSNAEEAKAPTENPVKPMEDMPPPPIPHDLDSANDWFEQNNFSLAGKIRWHVREISCP